MKVKFLLAVSLIVLLFSSTSFAWCITDIKKTKSCSGNYAYLVTDIQGDKYVLGFCLYQEQIISVINFLKADGLNDLIGQCHEEGKDWDRAPLVIKVMDQAAMLFKSPSKKPSKKEIPSSI